MVGPARNLGPVGRYNPITTPVSWVVDGRVANWVALTVASSRDLDGKDER